MQFYTLQMSDLGIQLQFLGLEELPSGFQIAENVQEHGFVDLVAKRGELAATVARIIGLLAPASRELAPAASP